jgi:Pyruvate/2-oxoacid:ferredoxin oxidoreductase gamma subunit
MSDKLKLRIFCTGVGDQGTLLATRLLGEATMEAGYNAQVSETHGMAQRGGGGGIHCGPGLPGQPHNFSG